MATIADVGLEVIVTGDIREIDIAI